jgi:5'-methylthioinosine phosphorylase
MLAIIGGTGLYELDGVNEIREESVVTPWGPPSGPLLLGRMGEQTIVFLPRHGVRHSIAPHEINYRANLWALRDAGVRSIVAVGAVGAIVEEPVEGGIVIPDQLIDYTWGRAATFFEGPESPVEHIDFTHPYTPALRERLLAAAAAAGEEVVAGGCYGATQGPRLETAAEILRMERDGCTLVGMTGMPEAALAREIGLEYACCAVVANKAAGKGDHAEVSLDDIHRNLDVGMGRVRAILASMLALKSADVRS